MVSLGRFQLLVLVLVPCIFVHGFADLRDEMPVEIENSDLELSDFLQDIPDDVPEENTEIQDDSSSKGEYKAEENHFLQDIPDDVPEEDTEIQDDSSSKGEYIAEENLGSSNFLEGDIRLDKSTQDIMDNLQSNARDAVTNPVQHWTGARVPYMFGGVSSLVRSAFKAAISDYNRYTCIRIVPRRSERNYIYVVSEGGCWSTIGMSRGRQKLSLGRRCEHKGTAIHELMHALGFFHEQSRRDRDNYIRINWGNIEQGRSNNFRKYRHGQADTLNAPYDYGSIMHYPEYAFSKNRRKTIVPNRSGVRIGQRQGFSKVDVQQINKLYKCSGGGGGVRPTRRPTRPPVVGCVDKYVTSCPKWAGYGYCKSSSKYGPFMRKSCRKSCRFCRSVKPRCYDKKRGCPGWTRYCKYASWNKYYGFMKENCKKTCRRC